MNRKLLTCLMFVAACAIVLSYREQMTALLSQSDVSVNNRAGKGVVPGTVKALPLDLEQEPSLESTHMLLEASQALGALPPVEAKVRHRTDLFGQQLSGPGRYLQVGQGSNHARLELTFTSGDYESKLTQINDGRFLYISNDTQNETSVRRIDLAGLEQPDSSSTVQSNSSNWMAMGGLQFLVHQLATDFNFGPPEETMLGKTRVLVLNGTWKPNRIADICRDIRVIDGHGKLLTDQFPPQMPTHVRIALGREEPLSLFPHQITWFRATQDEQGHVVKQELSTFEFFDVRPAKDLNAATFQLEKDATRLTDITNSVQKDARQALRLR